MPPKVLKQGESLRGDTSQRFRTGPWVLLSLRAGDVATLHAG
jgi:hypothetical protein